MRLNDVADGPTTTTTAAAAVSAQVTPATGFPVGDSTADTSAVLGDVGDDTIIAQYSNKMIFAVLDVSLIMGLNSGETDIGFYINNNKWPKCPCRYRTPSPDNACANDVIDSN